MIENDTASLMAYEMEQAVLAAANLDNDALVEAAHEALELQKPIRAYAVTDNGEFPFPCYPH